MYDRSVISNITISDRNIISNITTYDRSIILNMEYNYNIEYYIEYNYIR